MMTTWRALLILCFALLGGCLVAFKEPIPAKESAPDALLGTWTRQNEWGEQVFLELINSQPNTYEARVYAADQKASEPGRKYSFTVAHHGRRWYVSVALAQNMGGNFAIAGFQLTANGQLVIYGLDVERVISELQYGVLKGEAVESFGSSGALISSPLPEVLSFLDNPANADVFIEVARYQRADD